MTRPMVRWMATGALALVAAGVAGGLGSAEAKAGGGGSSPYAGSYTGGIGSGGGCQGGGPCNKPYWVLSVTVSSAGKVSGVANFFEATGPFGVYVSPSGDGSARGSLTTDGTIRLSVSDGKWHESVNATFTVDTNGVISADEPGGTHVTLNPQ